MEPVMEKKLKSLRETIEKLHKACISIGADNNEKRELLEEIRQLYIDLETALNSIADNIDIKQINLH